MTNQSSPVTDETLERLAADHALRWGAGGSGGTQAMLVAFAKEMLRIPAQSTLEDMARLSASEVACYRWPEDTAEHRAMRAAFCDGAAHTAVTSTDSAPTYCTPDGPQWCEERSDASHCGDCPVTRPDSNTVENKGDCAS